MLQANGGKTLIIHHFIRMSHTFFLSISKYQITVIDKTSFTNRKGSYVDFEKLCKKIKCFIHVTTCVTKIKNQNEFYKCVESSQT